MDMQLEAILAQFGRMPHMQGVKSVGTIMHRVLGRVKWKKRRKVGTFLAFGGIAGLIL